MDMIGGIKHMENRLGGRKPDHGKKEFAQNHAPKEAADEENSPAPAHHPSIEGEALLGRKVDTTA
ncbi:MAG: hypothetical protein IH605_13720 [Burkholderiales bacterium]|nr:hypothetical protein [Burkholderiales bacterium]